MQVALEHVSSFLLQCLCLMFATSVAYLLHRSLAFLGGRGGRAFHLVHCYQFLSMCPKWQTHVASLKNSSASTEKQNLDGDVWNIEFELSLNYMCCNIYIWIIISLEFLHIIIIYGWFYLFSVIWVLRILKKQRQTFGDMDTLSTVPGWMTVMLSTVRGHVGRVGRHFISVWGVRRHLSCLFWFTMLELPKL